jgi:hypothetical protein
MRRPRLFELMQLMLHALHVLEQMDHNGVELLKLAFLERDADLELGDALVGVVHASSSEKR